eukprot:gene13964-15421_t
MCEVTRSNFEDIFPEIEEAIRSSAFIAFDGEFTCLSSSSSGSPNLIDTAEVRYNKLKKTVQKSSLCQVGIAAFIPNPDEKNSYLVKTFNFYLFPGSFGPIECWFLCQCMYNGVSFLNQEQEKVIKTMHQTGKVQQHCSSTLIRKLDETLTRGLIDNIYDWKRTSKIEDKKSFHISVSGFEQYLILSELREQFDDLVCEFSSPGELRVTKKDPTLHSQDIRTSYDTEFEKLIQAQVGFSRVIQIISKAQKPIVGHNCLTDLLFICEKFHKPLPDLYTDFKSQLQDLFKEIYDTKHISMSLRRTEREAALFNETCLEDLHAMLSSKQGIFYSLGSPHIQHAPGYDIYESSNHLHEAGYDAYLTGYVFLRMAHFLAFKEKRADGTIALRFKDHLKAVKSFKNCINIARASLRYINIDGADEYLNSREQFLVSLKEGNKKNISATQIAHEFLSFGSVDVQLLGSKQALVTISQNRRAKTVVRAFHCHKTFRVENFCLGVKSESSTPNKSRSRIFGALALLVVITAGTFGCVLLRKRVGEN